MGAKILDFNDPEMIERRRLKKQKELEEKERVERSEQATGIVSEHIEQIEYTLIGSLLFNSELLEFADKLKPYHFSFRLTRHIFRFIYDRHIKGQPTDGLIMKSHMDGNPHLWDLQIDVDSTIEILLSAALRSPIQVKAYADELLDHNARIDLKKAISKASNSLFNPDISARSVINDLNEQFTKIYDDVAANDRVGFMSIDDVLEMPPPEWIIDGYLQEETLSCVYAPSFTGKSYFALDMALSVAQGTDWHGHKVKPFNVAYIAAEGARGMSIRANAWLSARQSQDVMPNFVFYKQPVDFFDQLQLNHFIRLCEAENIQMVVVDTLARCFGGRDENSAQDMSGFIDAADRLKRAIKGHVMIIHHTGKELDKGARGSTVIKDAVDTQIELKKDPEQPVLRALVHKQKDGDLQDIKYLEFVRRESHHPTTGELITSAILQPHQQSGRAPSVRLGKNELMIMRELVKGEAGFGWLQKETGMDKGNLGRAIRTLIEKGLIGTDGNDPVSYRKLKDV